MIIQWLKGFFGVGRAEILAQGAREADKRSRAGLDVHESLETLAEEAAKKGLEFVGVLQQGGQILRRQRMRQKVRRVVTSKISPAYDYPEIVDEVTEKITEAALADPAYKHLFQA